MRWCGKAFALLQRSNRFCFGKGFFRFCYLKKSKQGKSGHEYFSLLRQDCGRGLDHLLDYWGQVGNIATPRPAGLLHFASFGIHTKCPANKQDGDNMRNILHKK